MKKVTWVAVLMIALLLAVHGVSLGQQEEKISPEAVKKETGEALDAAKKYTLQQKEEYQKKVEAELGDLSKKIGELKARAVGLKGEAVKSLETQMTDLKKKQKVAEDKLKEYESSSSQALQDLKIGLDNSLKELKKAYDGIVGQFK